MKDSINPGKAEAVDRNDRCDESDEKNQVKESTAKLQKPFENKNEIGKKLQDVSTTAKPHSNLCPPKVITPGSMAAEFELAEASSDDNATSESPHEREDDQFAVQIAEEEDEISYSDIVFQDFDEEIPFQGDDDQYERTGTTRINRAPVELVTASYVDEDAIASAAVQEFVRKNVVEAAHIQLVHEQDNSAIDLDGRRGGMNSLPARVKRSLRRPRAFVTALVVLAGAILLVVLVGDRNSRPVDASFTQQPKSISSQSSSSIEPSAVPSQRPSLAPADPPSIEPTISVTSPLPSEQPLIPTQSPSTPLPTTSSSPTAFQTARPTQTRVRFDTRASLLQAVDSYLDRLRLGTGATTGMGDWDVSRIEDFSELFSSSRHLNAGYFNHADVSNWNTSSATTMRAMFKGARDFNRNLDNFDTSKVTDMSEMFYGASKFDRVVIGFDTRNTQTMYRMFRDAINFNGNLNFDTVRTTNMSEMFFRALNFKHPLSNFDTSKVTQMRAMFSRADSFNQDLSMCVCVSCHQHGFNVQGCGIIQSKPMQLGKQSAFASTLSGGDVFRIFLPGRCLSDFTKCYSGNRIWSILLPLLSIGSQIPSTNETMNTNK